MGEGRQVLLAILPGDLGVDALARLERDAAAADADALPPPAAQPALHRRASGIEGDDVLEPARLEIAALHAGSRG